MVNYESSPAPRVRADSALVRPGIFCEIKILTTYNQKKPSKKV